MHARTLACSHASTPSYVHRRDAGALPQADEDENAAPGAELSGDQEGNISDEMRASLITFTTETSAEVNVLDRCTEAPLLGVILSLF